MLDPLAVKIEQIRRGFVFFTSLFSRKATSVAIYTTTRCNGRCQTCYIWKKREKKDISLTAVKNILKSTSWGVQYFLTGGEFLLHPEYEKILQLFKNKNLILLSNGILSNKLIETVKKHNIKRVVLSFDGVGKTYQKVRSIDNFDNLHHLIHQLKKECILSLNYTISPLNNKKEEILKADQFAKKHRLYLSFGIYDNPEFFNTKLKKLKIPHLNVSRPYPLGKYLDLYNQWLEGKFHLPCFSVRNSPMVLPDGSVCLCQGKNTILGNLNQMTLSKIWNNPKTKQVQNKFLTCNDCWLLCQKPMDIFTWDLMSLLPKTILPKKFHHYPHFP